MKRIDIANIVTKAIAYDLDIEEVIIFMLKSLFKIMLKVYLMQNIKISLKIFNILAT